MRALDRNVGLAAGLAAAVSLVLCVFVFQVTLVLSLVPSVLVGAAVLLLAPGGPMGRRLTPDKEEAEAIAQSKAKLGRLGKMIDELNDPHAPGATAARAVLIEADKCLYVIGKDANKFEAAGPFLKKYVTPLERWMEGYLRVLERDLEFARDALKAAERDTLPRLVRDFETLYEQLHINDVVQMQTGSITELRFAGIELNDEEFSQ